eukprot:225876-Pelagomonas_calceolata.AAC.2
MSSIEDTRTAHRATTHKQQPLQTEDEQHRGYAHSTLSSTTHRQQPLQTEDEWHRGHAQHTAPQHTSSYRCKQRIGGTVDMRTTHTRMHMHTHMAPRHTSSNRCTAHELHGAAGSIEFQYFQLHPQKQVAHMQTGSAQLL